MFGSENKPEQKELIIETDLDCWDVSRVSETFDPRLNCVSRRFNRLIVLPKTSVSDSHLHTPGVVVGVSL